MGWGGGAPWKLRLNNHLINFQIALRKLEYLNNSAKVPFRAPRKILQRLRYRRLSELYGFTIPANVFSSGLCIVHRGAIVVNSGVSVGRNCRIHQGVTLGSVDGKCPTIGQNVWIGAGAVLLGDIKVGDGAAIGANAVVTKDVPPGETWGGVPASRIQVRDSSRWMRVWYD